MRRHRHTYHFNPHTLKYEKVIVSISDRVKKISYPMLAGFLLGVLLTFVGIAIFDSPKEKRLKREVSQYRHRLESVNRHVTRAEQVLSDLEQRDDELYRTIFGVEPLRDSIPFVPLLTDNTEVDPLLRNTSRRVDSLSNRLYAQSLSMDEVYEMARSKQERMAAIPAIMPIRKKDGQIVSGFGYRYHPLLRTMRMHTGIDISARKGVPVYATGDGVVEVAGSGIEGFAGYGVVCVINHGFGFKTLYAHLGKTTVKKGQKVRRGEQIGTLGSTGLSQGPHVHYEVIQNNKRVNPVYFFFNDLTPAEYEKVIELANQENQCLS